MILAIAITVILSSIVAVLTWTVRLLRISSLGACALAEKLAFPEPASALEWPELRVLSVVPQPDDRQTLERVHATLLKEDSRAR